MSEQLNTGKDLLRIEDLHVSIPLLGGSVEAVKGASLRILPGKVTALVGESGSGKSIISQVIMGLEPEIATVSGKVLFTDPQTPDTTQDMLELPRDGRRIRAMRGNRISMIFQEPMTSLNPLHSIERQVGESLKLHRGLTGAAARTRILELLSW